MDNIKNRELIRTLLDCAAACEDCATACLHEEDVKQMSECIALDRDCADICALAARLLQRDSGIAAKFLAVCGDMCRRCKEECSRHGHHDHCLRCAEACCRCAEACQAAANG
ncbi:MAG TPA: four-helix bundle copper-binding protein [Mucilaginibacter sp.]|nr:four-helix bundle copper-binding protein [Mucilaginibacter sp.]